MAYPRVMTAGQRRRLTDVARGAAPADLYVRGGTLLNVYTGELYPANVAARGERIAYVGVRDEMVGARTQVSMGPAVLPRLHRPARSSGDPDDAVGARPIHPAARHHRGGRGHVAVLGARRPRRVPDRGRALMTSPLRFYWMVRPHAQAGAGRVAAVRRRDPGESAGSSAHAGGRGGHALARRLARRSRLLRRLGLARGARVEGHTAGASGEKIPAIAAAGFTSDHEPITAQEVLDRARQGIAVMLRESSLRPDLVGLLDALKTAPALASRLMLTNDGSMPAFLRTTGSSIT